MSVKFRKPARLFAYLFAAVTCALLFLQACQEPAPDGEIIMDVDVDPAYLASDRVVVVMVDSAQGMRDTLFNDSLKSLSQLKSLAVKEYQGQHVLITIEAYKGGEIFLSQRRKFDGKSDATLSTDTLTWLPAAIQSVRLPADSLVMRAGQASQAISAILTPAYADAELAFTSSNPTVLTLAAGSHPGETVASPHAQGVAWVIARSVKDPSKSDSLRVIVQFALPVKVVMDSAEIRLQPGRMTDTAEATVLPATANPALIWSIQDSAVAVVSPEGVVTGRKPGITILRSKSVADTSVQAAARVRVESLAAASLALEQRSLKAYVGAGPVPVRFHVLPPDASQEAVWISRDTAVVQVTTTGSLIATGPGTTTVVAAAFGNPDARDSALVIARIDVPVLDPGSQDTLIAVNSSVAFQIGVNQEFGSIETFRWDANNDGKWDDFSGPFPQGTLVLKTTPILLSQARTDSIRFYVKDSEGNEATATRRFQVASRVPRILSLTGDTLVSIGDSAVFKLECEAPLGTLAAVSWDLTGDGNDDRSVSAVGKSASITAGYRYSAAGTYNIRAKVTDDSGKIATQTHRLIVVQDAPVARAGSDTTVKPTVPVTFRGTATQAFGTILMYKWDFDGNGLFDDSSITSGSMSFTYPREGVYNAIFSVRDDDGNISKDTARVSVVNPPPAILTLKSDTLISIHDSISVWAIAADEGRIVKWAWDFDGNSVYDDSANVDASQIDATAGHRYPSEGVWQAVIRVTDELGKQTRDTLKVTVIKDDPLAEAGPDTTVTVNDLISLRGYRSTDGFGLIVKWEWRVGAGPFIRVSRSDTLMAAPATANPSLRCYLRVTDDDGNIAVDSLTVIVTAGAPKVTAGPDTAVGLGKQIRLRGSATDDGRIVKYEWSLGDTSVWYRTSRSDTNVLASAIPASPYLYILRVTDEDGFVGRDTTLVTVGMAWVRATDSAFPSRHGHASLVFSNRMWVFGGGSYNPLEVWSSSNGIQWRLDASPAETGRSQFAATVHQNRMWFVGGQAGWQFNDAWSSPDGANWRNDTSHGVTPYDRRDSHAMVSFGGKLCVLGGQSEGIRLNDVLSSTNGVDWSAPAFADFCGRSGHTAVVFGGKIWVIGGEYDEGASFGTQSIWSWDEVSGWTAEVDVPPFGQRYGHASVVMDQKIWVIGGKVKNSVAGQPDIPMNDAWYSSDGKTWIQATAAAGFSPRFGHTLLNYDGKLWVIGGSDKGSEVWYSSDLP